MYNLQCLERTLISYFLVGDCMVRELDFSKVTIRLRESSKDKEHDEDDIVAKLTGQTMSTLRQCLVCCSLAYRRASTNIN